MKRYRITTALLIAFAITYIAPYGMGSTAIAVTQTSKTRSSKSTGTKSKKTANTKTKTNQRNNTATLQPKTSSEARKLQEAASKEIKLTEQQLRENEKSVKAGLARLRSLEADISATQGRVDKTDAKLKSLSTEISNLQSSIDSNQKDLDRLKGEYLKAVKKMRTSQRGQSTMMFIFSSENFNQAMRRMRYLRQFSEWKSRRTDAINRKNRQLESDRSNLAKLQDEEKTQFGKQQADLATLQQQHSQQNAIVSDLKKNGTALKSHLNRKQNEANQLRQRVTDLIAQEQRKAAEEEARKQEQMRKAEEARKAEEMCKAEEARKAQENLIAADTKKSEEKRKPKETAEPPKAKSSGNTTDKAQYAEARKRKPRTASKSSDANKTVASTTKPAKSVETPSQTPTPVKAAPAAPAKSVASGDFAAMKGKLRLPSSGSFKVTSRFGRQTLPDLPDVVYENPGIDAEVPSGATAAAVFNGKVSGVYMLPGYNTVVIINHGGYYSVYGNIATPSVKVGEMVSAGQQLGTVAADDDNPGKGSIHFEIWKNREKLNPLDWLRPV